MPPDQPPTAHQPYPPQAYPPQAYPSQTYPSQASAPVPVPTLPAEGTPYHHFLRTPRHRWWKPLLLVVGVLVAYGVLSLATMLVAIVVDVVSGRNRDILSGGNPEMTPALFLGTNVGLALMVPACLLLQWAVYGQRPRWLSSVEGGFRWGLLARCALVLVPIYVVYVGGTTLLTGLPSGPVQPEAVAFVVITLLTTPLQSAGEEYAVRGLLTRAFAAWLPPRFVAFVVASLLSAGVFAAGHPNLTPWRLAAYLIIALGFSVLVWRTGGLEAAVLGHALNNVLVIVPTALWGDMTAALLGVQAEAGPLDAVIMVALAAVSWVGVELVFRRSRYVRVAPASVGPAAPSGAGPVAAG